MIWDSLNLNIFNIANLIKEYLRDAIRLSKKASITCPNPKCGKTIEETILLNVLSVNPPKKYEACPYCFTNVEDIEPIKQKEAIEAPEIVEPENTIIEETKESTAGVFDRVRSIIQTRDKKEDIEEPQYEPDAPKKEEKQPKTYEPLKKERPAEKSKEDNKSGCPERFGYLANRPDGEAIPQYCLTCPKMVDCMLSPKEY